MVLEGREGETERSQFDQIGLALVRVLTSGRRQPLHIEAMKDGRTVASRWSYRIRSHLI